MDIDALDQLLNAQEEEKLEEIRALIKDIQETRKNNPEVRCINVNDDCEVSMLNVLWPFGILC